MKLPPYLVAHPPTSAFLLNYASTISAVLFPALVQGPVRSLTPDCTIAIDAVRRLPSTLSPTKGICRLLFTSPPSLPMYILYSCVCIVVMQAEGDSYSAENVTDDEGGIREGAEGYSVLYGARILGSKDGKSKMLEWNAPTGYSPERWKVEDSGLNEAHDVITVMTLVFVTSSCFTTVGRWVGLVERAIV